MHKIHQTLPLFLPAPWLIAPKVQSDRPWKEQGKGYVATRSHNPMSEPI